MKRVRFHSKENKKEGLFKSKGRERPDSRRERTMDTLHADVIAALQEAASCGNNACAKVLQEHSANVPQMPPVSKAVAAARKMDVTCKPVEASTPAVSEDAAIDSPGKIGKLATDKDVDSPGVLLLEPEPEADKPADDSNSVESDSDQSSVRSQRVDSMARRR